MLLGDNRTGRNCLIILKVTNRPSALKAYPGRDSSTRNKAMTTETVLPLEGIRVVEFTTAWVGPGCGMMLSEMGAEIIKIENPKLPDYWRRLQAYYRGEGINRSASFAVLNRGKKSCLLDLKRPEDVDKAKKLVKISDIVIENYAPRVMESLGLGYSVLKDIKPDLIMISASGYGATGPDRDCLAFGPVLEAYSGLASLIGYPDGPPLPCGTTPSDHIGGITSAFAVLAALHHRDMTGEGQHIDLSEVESLTACIPEAVMEFTMNGRAPLPKGNRDEAMAPHGTYRCAGDDKWIAIAAGMDSEWKDLCLVMEKPELIDDERFIDGFSRLKNQDDLDRIITEWTKDRTPLDIMTKLQQANIAAGPVYSGEELYKDPHLRARGFFVEHNHPEVGKRELPGVFAKLSETPAAITGHDPLLGEHTDWVLNELLSSNDLQKETKE